MELESRGVPTMLIATDEFASLARRLAEQEGSPATRIIITPHPIGGTALKTLQQWASRATDSILSTLASNGR